MGIEKPKPMPPQTGPGRETEQRGISKPPPQSTQKPPPPPAPPPAPSQAKKDTK